MKLVDVILEVDTDTLVRYHLHLRQVSMFHACINLEIIIENFVLASEDAMVFMYTMESSGPRTEA